MNSSLGTICPMCRLLCSPSTTFPSFGGFFPLKFVLPFSAPVLERWELCGAVHEGEKWGAMSWHKKWFSHVPRAAVLAVSHPACPA